MEPLKVTIKNRRTGYELHVFNCTDRSLLPRSLSTPFGKFCNLVYEGKPAIEVKKGWDKIDNSIPDYKIGFWSDDSSKLEFVNEVIRKDIEEIQNKSHHEAAEEPDDATSETRIEIEADNTDKEDPAKENPVVQIHSESPEGTLLVQTNRPPTPEHCRKLKFYFAKFLTRLYAGEDSNLNPAWRSLQFRYDLVDDWAAFTSLLSDEDMLAFIPSSSFIQAEREHLTELFERIRQADRDYLRRAIVNAKANASTSKVPDPPQSTAHSFAFSKPEVPQSMDHPSPTRPTPPMAVASLASSPNAPNSRNKQVGVVLPAGRAKQTTPSSTSQSIGTDHSLPEGSFAIDPTLIAESQSSPPSVSSSGSSPPTTTASSREEAQMTGPGGDEEPIWEDYVSFGPVEVDPGSQATSTVGAQPASTQVVPAPPSKPVPEGNPKPSMKPKTKFAVNKSLAAMRVPNNGGSGGGQVPASATSNVNASPTPKPTTNPSSKPSQNPRPSFSSLVGSSLKGINGNPLANNNIPTPPTTSQTARRDLETTPAETPSSQSQDQVPAILSPSPSPRSEIHSSIAIGAEPVTPPPSPLKHSNTRKQGEEGGEEEDVTPRQLAFASDNEAEEEEINKQMDELSKIAVARVGRKTKKAASTKRLGKEKIVSSAPAPAPAPAPVPILVLATPVTFGPEEEGGEPEENGKEGEEDLSESRKPITYTTRSRRGSPGDNDTEMEVDPSLVPASPVAFEPEEEPEKNNEEGGERKKSRKAVTYTTKRRGRGSQEDNDTEMENEPSPAVGGGGRKSKKTAAKNVSPIQTRASGKRISEPEENGNEEGEKEASPVIQPRKRRGTARRIPEKNGSVISEPSMKDEAAKKAPAVRSSKTKTLSQPQKPTAARKGKVTSEVENADSDVEESKEQLISGSEEDVELEEMTEAVTEVKKKPRSRATNRPARKRSVQKRRDTRGRSGTKRSTDSEVVDRKTKRRKMDNDTDEDEKDKDKMEVDGDEDSPVANTTKVISPQTLQRLINDAVEIDMYVPLPPVGADACLSGKREETMLGIVRMKTELIELVGTLVKQGRA